jgi:signal transduction histidine kinase
VQVDAEQLRQVLMNLVRNAMQSMNGRGVVRICSRCHREAGSSGWVEVSVHDDGSGMAPQVLKNLFVPFFTTKDRGTGLGLAISQRIVEKMGGRIDVLSHPGRGSTFSVVLPSVVDPLSPQRVSPKSGGLTPPPKPPVGQQEGEAERPEVPALTQSTKPGLVS